MIVALLPEAGSDGGALFLNYGSLVGDRLGGSDIANKLLDYLDSQKSALGPRLGRWNLGVMAMSVAGALTGTHGDAIIRGPQRGLSRGSGSEWEWK